LPFGAASIIASRFQIFPINRLSPRQFNPGRCKPAHKPPPRKACWIRLHLPKLPAAASKLRRRRNLPARFIKPRPTPPPGRGKSFRYTNTRAPSRHHQPARIAQTILRDSAPRGFSAQAEKNLQKIASSMMIFVDE
jgi:hypothetical protein